MANTPNDLSKDPSQLSIQEKLDFFEKNVKGQQARSIRQPTALSSTNIFPKKSPNSSNSDNNKTPSPSQQQNLSSSNGFLKKTSTSTPNISPSTNNSSSLELPNSSQNSSGKSASKEQSQFQQPELKIPEILEVFTDLDSFIDNELSEISTRKRIGKKMTESETSKDAATDVFTKLKVEFLNDKMQYQKEFQKQMRQHGHKKEMKFSTIDEEEEDEENDEDVSLLDLTINSRMNRLRDKKIDKLRLEAVKQEYLLSKIGRVLDQITVINNRNVVSIVNIERHYLVSSYRLQSALTELRRLTNMTEALHPRPFHLKGKCILSDITLEVDLKYLERQKSSHNEFVLVLLKYDDEIYASMPICITDDVRTIKFPNTFLIPEAFLDFSMRLEVHGTTFWRRSHSIRATMLKKYGFVNFSLADTGENRKRFEMVEVIKSELNPLCRKIIMRIRQSITCDVHFQGPLKVKLGNEWYKTRAQLCGHLLQIELISDEDTNPMLLDLHNFDNDFVIPVVSHISKCSNTFLLKFNHYVDGNEFFLLVAAESAEDYYNWVSQINKVLALIKPSVR